MKKQYALSDVVLRMVIKKGDRLELHSRAPEAFRAAMDALFKHPALDPKEEIEALVRLGLMFERDHAFELAEAIIDLLAQDDRALLVLGISPGKKTREAKTQFAKLVTGTRMLLAAPAFGKEAPLGSVKASSFLNPGRQIRRTPPTPPRLTASRR